MPPRAHTSRVEPVCHCPCVQDVSPHSSVSPPPLQAHMCVHGCVRTYTHIHTHRMPQRGLCATLYPISVPSPQSTSPQAASAVSKPTSCSARPLGLPHSSKHQSTNNCQGLASSWAGLWKDAGHLSCPESQSQGSPWEIMGKGSTPIWVCSGCWGPGWAGS